MSDTLTVIGASIIAIAAGAVTFVVVSLVGIAFWFWMDAAERSDAARNGCRRSPGCKGCNHSRGRDGSRLRVINHEEATA